MSSTARGYWRRHRYTRSAAVALWLCCVRPAAAWAPSPPKVPLARTVHPRYLLGGYHDRDSHGPFQRDSRASPSGLGASRSRRRDGGPPSEGRRPSRRPRPTWRESYEALAAFRRQHGHCRVPYQTSGLGRWVSHQRRSFRKLTEEQRQALDALGFDWRPRDSAWESKLEQLKAYKHKYGHCNVPQDWNEDKSLANWVRSVRRNRKSLSDERRAPLDEIGFDWAPREADWTGMYQQLQEFRHKNGHCRVPHRNSGLGQWVGEQRRKANRLTGEQRQALEELGFDWSPRESTWKMQLEKLMAYKRKYGSCNVPRDWIEDKSLAKWVCRQRSGADKLTDKKRRALDELGFDWSLLESAWETQLEKLKAYKHKYGHCYVPRDWTEDRSLGSWVGTQRRRVAELTDQQRQALEELGFDWSPRESTWEMQLEKLKAYRRKYGNCNVPKDWAEDRSLGLWVYNMRQQRDSLSDERRAHLDKIGFDWTPLETDWNRMYSQLRAFQHNNGHCRVPNQPEYTALRQWAKKQRDMKSKGRMRPEREAKLNELKFPWSLRAREPWTLDSWHVFLKNYTK